jgi:hypothetical protein
MAIQLRSRTDAAGNPGSFYDASTFETTDEFHPVRMFEDFVGPGHVVPAAGSAVPGYAWVAKIVDTSGAPTVAVVSNGSAGVMAATLDATSEKQDAAIYAGDVLNWNATEGLVFEARIAMHVLPSAAAVQMVWGVSSAWIDGPNNRTYYLEFEALASGLVNVRKKDGVATTSVSSGVTLVADAYHVFRIAVDSTPTATFYIDGANVGTAAWGATSGNSVLQPYMSAYKASGTGVGTLYVDRVMLAMNRS